MINSRNTTRQQSNFDLSKFWAFHFNHSSYSHAINLTTRKLPGSVLSVSFTTHNSDHIIGSTTFGDLTLSRNDNSIARFVNAHYHERRKGLPFRVLVVDVYKRAYVFRRFISNKYDGSKYKQIEGWTYVMNSDAREQEHVVLSNLMFNNLNYVYKTQYEDKNGKIITHYVTDPYHIFSQVWAGTTLLNLDAFPTNRIITTIYHGPSDSYKIIITSFNRTTLEPQNKVLYCFGECQTYYNKSDFFTFFDLDIDDETFVINRYEGPKTRPVLYKYDQHKAEGLVLFNYKHEGYKYELVFGDHTESFVSPNVGPFAEKLLEIKQDTFDRILLLSYPPKEPIPPNYYIFDRMDLYNKFVCLFHME
ncbi:hypothetical protein MACK_002799 [Theileria orientalis]|uniref:Uncharacterized protein n=1 Tax=Theileria orientalis TaxID=68886 RepID=A0A976MDL7_THEOR|nr:hypothetical protein MACK_002799 [Theileria orientalis]